MIRIGLTGSIGMGKSAVAEVFASHGIPVFDADKEVHSLYDSAEGAALLKKDFPAAIRDNHVDRSLLGEILVKHPEKLGTLEKLVHAEIGQRRESFYLAARKAGHRLAVADIPLLLEKGRREDFDVVVVVSAPEALQKERVLKRPGMNPAKLDLILSRQMPDVEKRRLADVIIENNGTLAELQAKTIGLIQKLKKNADP